MKTRIILFTLILAMLSLASVQNVLAGVNHSIIIIGPQYPLTVNTPATFGISTTPASDPTYDPHILLAMTVACYNGLTNVVVSWTGGSIAFAKSDFQLLSGSPPPKVPSDTISELQYDRSNLATHLGESGSADVYWAMASFLGGAQLHTTAQEFIVTVNSIKPKVLVYALGKASATDTKLNRWVPPTNPGFVIPELGPILLASASMIALGLYAATRKKTILLK